MQQIARDLRPKRRVPASQLDIARVLSLDRQHPQHLKCTRSLFPYLRLGVPGKQRRGQVLVQNPHVILFQAAPAAQKKKANITPPNHKSGAS